jgi:hypothetical protein
MARRSTNGAGPWERQLALFDPAPSSPPPAHPALAGMRKGVRRRVFEAVVRAGALGLTSDEIESMLGKPHQCVSPRVHELMVERLIVDSGKRRRTREGREAVVYVVRGTKLRKEKGT